MSQGPKILFIDIETKPLVAYAWQLFDVNISLDQLLGDISILSYAAKWADEASIKRGYSLNEKNVIQNDLRGSKDYSKDKKLLKEIKDLLNEADIVVGHNLIQFDHKMINSRFLLNKIQPPKTYLKSDTLVIAKKHFRMTSNKLEYLADKVNKVYKKLKHENFPGNKLWTECLNGNKKAWDAMAKYNVHDVLSLEELYYRLIPYDGSINFNVFYDKPTCSCGSTKFHSKGIKRLTTGSYRRYICKRCGKESRGTKRLGAVDRVGTVR